MFPRNHRWSQTGRMDADKLKRILKGCRRRERELERFYAEEQDQWSKKQIGKELGICRAHIKEVEGKIREYEKKSA